MLTLASVMRSEMKKRKLEFSSHPGNLALMRNFVRHFLDNMPISERDRTLMVLGVDEACTNIIRHAYELRDDQLIALSLEIRDDYVRMRLRDYGMQPPMEALHRRRRRDEAIRPDDPERLRSGGLYFAAPRDRTGVDEEDCVKSTFACFIATSSKAFAMLDLSG
jgi:anti-sigma regulatory factor (Ser/Thr protein kinase)